MKKSEQLKKEIIGAFGSSTAFAKACKVTPQHINNWFHITGFPKTSLLMVERLAKDKGLNITVYDLIKYEPPKEKKAA